MNDGTGLKLKFDPMIAYEHYLASPAGLCAIDRDLRYLTWNDALARISGVPAEEALGKKVFELFPFLEAIGEREIHRRVFNGESVLADPRPYDVPEKNRKGYFQGLYSPWRDKDGNIIGIFISIRDVGISIDRLLSLRDLSTELSRVTTLPKTFDTTLNFLTRMTGAKRGVISILSDDKKELVTQSRIGLEPTNPAVERLRIDLPLPLAVAARTGQPVLLSTLDEVFAFSSEFGNYLKSRGDSACGAFPLVVEGESLGSMAVAYEKEHRFSAEEVSYMLAACNLCAQSYARARQFEREKAARAKAEEADRAKTRFLANVSHELRTPMTAIVGFAELIKNTFADSVRSGDSAKIEKLESFAGNILKHSLSFKKILDDILDLTRIESGQFRIEKEVVALQPWLNEIVLVANQMATEKPIAVELVLDRDTPRSLLMDPIRAKQIMLNLLSNAVKFTDEGRILIQVGAGEIPSGRSAVRIVVQDTGIGMRSDSGGNEPFATPLIASDRRGSGIGLAIARRLAQALDGSLRLLKTAPMEGTSFELLLPVERTESSLSPIATVAVETSRTESLKHVQSKSLAGITVLVADDEADVLLYLCESLKSAGAKVIAARDGAEAVELALTNKVDFFLLDLQMPRLDGFEAAGQLRASGCLQPLLALTAHGLPEFQSAAQKSGFGQFLVKPVELSSLVDTILTMLGCKQP